VEQMSFPESRRLMVANQEYCESVTSEPPTILWIEKAREGKKAPEKRMLQNMYQDHKDEKVILSMLCYKEGVKCEARRRPSPRQLAIYVLKSVSL
jgi:hypothetical protein